jgi:hypothetical protein
MIFGPAYHLRTNKAVERLLFLEALRLAGPLPKQISQYTYVGMGGPYLEDFNLLHLAFGITDMISLEIRADVLTRQTLNQPHSCVKLTKNSTRDFVNQLEPRLKPYLVWFDYEFAKWKEQLDEICDLLRQLPSMSILKVTLPCSTKWLKVQKDDNKAVADKMSELFSDYGPFTEGQVTRKAIASTMYGLCRKVIGDAIPDSRQKCVRSLASYAYDDGTQILTVTMIVGPLDKVELVGKALSRWPFSDINWSGPKTIAVPPLSLREKLAIDSLLPNASARTVINKLRLRFTDNYEESVQMLTNYVEVYRHVPQFVRITV